MPSTGAPPRMPANPITGADVVVIAARMPGTSRIGPIDTTGLLGATKTRSADSIASTTPDRRPGGLDAEAADRERFGLSPKPDPVLLEVQPATAVAGRRIGDGDLGLDDVVRHRQQPQRWIVGQPPTGDPAGDLRQRQTRCQQLGPGQVGAQVEVAEAEPGGFHPVRRELLLDPPGLRRAAPTTFGVDPAAEGVGHGVEVGTDPQPVHRHVVGGVDDHRQLRVRVRRAHPRHEP